VPSRPGSRSPRPCRPCRVRASQDAPTQPVTAPPPALVDGQGIKTKQQGRLTDRVSRGRGGATRWEDRGLSLRTRLLARLTLPRRHA
jgi:hypothetical protein